MMKIAILNQKGGVGKTTVSVNLAYGLALQQQNTLLVDIDPQGHSSIIYQHPEHPPQNTMSEVLGKKSFPIQNAIYPGIINKKEVDHLFLIPSNIHLATTAEHITSRIHREKILHNQLNKIEKQYDFVLIDCPPTLGVLTINAILTADFILIPTTYGRYALDGIADLFGSIREVKEDDNAPYRILKNSYDQRTTQSNEFVTSQLQGEQEKGTILKTIIRKTETINQSQMMGEPIFTFDPKGRAAEDFAALTTEILTFRK